MSPLAWVAGALPLVSRPNPAPSWPAPLPTAPARLARVMPSWPRLVVQRSSDPSRCCSSGLSWRQRPWPTSSPNRPISRPPVSTASIGAPLSRSALVTSTRPSSSTTPPQLESRGRLSSVANSGNSTRPRPRGRASSPAKVASMAAAGQGRTPLWVLCCGCSPAGAPCRSTRAGALLRVLCLNSVPAHLAELVDALGLGSSGFGRGGSSPPVGTTFEGSATPAGARRAAIGRWF